MGVGGFTLQTCEPRIHILVPASRAQALSPAHSFYKKLHELSDSGDQDDQQIAGAETIPA